MFIPYFVAFLVFSGTELSSKISKNSFKISTKREADAIVLVALISKPANFATR